jgi:hypothetical protein
VGDRMRHCNALRPPRNTLAGAEAFNSINSSNYEVFNVLGQIEHRKEHAQKYMLVVSRSASIE